MITVIAITVITITVVITTKGGRMQFLGRKRELKLVPTEWDRNHLSLSSCLADGGSANSGSFGRRIANPNAPPAHVALAPLRR